MTDTPTKHLRFEVRRRVVIEERATIEIDMPVPTARWEGKREAERLAEEKQHELRWALPKSATYFSAHKPTD